MFPNISSSYVKPTRVLAMYAVPLELLHKHFYSVLTMKGGSARIYLNETIIYVIITNDRVEMCIDSTDRLHKAEQNSLHKSVT